MAVLIAALFVAGAAEARNFKPPQQLSLNNHAATVSVAIDDTGNALATWADAGMYYSVRPAGKPWSKPQTVYVGGAFPVMHMTGAGAATIVSYESGYGIWSIDRPPAGAWGSPALIVDAPDIVSPAVTNVSPVQFLINTPGDQAIVFQQYADGNTLITAMRRPAGGSWGAQETVASSASYGRISLSSAALGDNGDLVVTFETFSVVCPKYCHQIDFVVHAAREPSGSSAWSDSGALTPQSSAYHTRTVIDPRGRAAVLLQNGFSATIQAATQLRAGAKWHPLVTAFASAGSDGAQMWAASAGTGGWASLAFVYLANAGGGATILDGDLATDTWPASHDLSANDIPGANDNMVFAADAGGSAVAEWTDTDGTVRAAIRNSPTAAWSAPQEITAGSACDVGGVVCTGAVAAAVNKFGRAVIAYIRLDPTVTYSTLYVAVE